MHWRRECYPRCVDDSMPFDHMAVQDELEERAVTAHAIVRHIADEMSASGAQFDDVFTVELPDGSILPGIVPEGVQ
jgi:hypothetical protein